MSNNALPQGSFSRYPLLWIAVLFAFGIAVERHTEFGLTFSLIFVGIAGCLSVIRRSAAGILLPLVFIPLGSTCLHIEKLGIRPDRVREIYTNGQIASYDPVEIEGVLARSPERAFAGTFLRLQTAKLISGNVERPVSGDVRLFVANFDDVSARELEELDLRYGSRIRVMCRLEREERFRNPGVASRIAILDEQGIDATSTIKSPKLIEKLGVESVFVPLRWLYEYRQALVGSFHERFSPTTAGVMIASLLGDKHYLDRDTAEVFRDGGTFHVLVISGLHITFIGGLTIWVVSFLTKRKSLQAILSSSFLWAYTLAVGGEIPVVRASMMFSIILFAQLIYRTGSLVNALGTCTLLLLVCRPSDLFSASFQLTFISVAGIVGCSVPLVEKLRAIGRWMPSVSQPLSPVVPRWLRRFCESLYWNQVEWQIEGSRQIWSANLYKSPYLKWARAVNMRALTAYLFEGILVSFIVQMWMLPLMVIYFHRVSPASILLNLWVGVFIALESFAAIMAVLLGAFSSWLAGPLIVLTEFLNAAMMWLPSYFYESSFASSRVPIYSGSARAVYILFGIGVVAAAIALFSWDPFVAYRRSLRYTLISAFVLTLVAASVVIFHPYSSPSPTGRLQVDFLDVGQGDSALVTFPNGETMLVDGGGRVSYSDASGEGFEPDLPSIGESVVSEFLWEKGYSRVDYLVATHADADHIQGLVDVARNFEIGCVLVGTTPVNNAEFEKLLSVIGKRSIPIRLIRNEDKMLIGGATIAVFNPSGEEHHSTNNSSVVMRIAYGSRSFLLTGDIERDAETAIVRNELSRLKADVVKVPHHGSRTSSTTDLVNYTQAGLAVISVGHRSRFGHPHPEIVERWRQAGTGPMTTGEMGTISVATDGSSLEIQTFAH